MDPTAAVLDALPWLSTAGLAVLVSLGMDLVKPYIELALPASRADLKAIHDATLRLALVLLNFGAILALASMAGALDWSRWPDYLIVAAGQALGGHWFYARGADKNSGGPTATIVPGSMDPAPPFKPAPAPLGPVGTI